MNKEKILQACFTHVQKRIDQIQLAIDDANYSIREETKSSAGDKYETIREMIQQDLSRYQQQLKLAQQDYEQLQRIAEQQLSAPIVSNGSIVFTDKATYFVAVSIGEVKIDGNALFVISIQSPIGQNLKGKKVGDSIAFRNGPIQYITQIS